MREEIRPIKEALVDIQFAQQRLEDDYPNWDRHGQQYAVESAARALRRAHQRVDYFIKKYEEA
jgi:hypothetical protein